MNRRRITAEKRKIVSTLVTSHCYHHPPLQNAPLSKMDDIFNMSAPISGHGPAKSKHHISHYPWFRTDSIKTARNNQNSNINKEKNV
jgi:hypothetical protein